MTARAVVHRDFPLRQNIAGGPFQGRPERYQSRIGDAQAMAEQAHSPVQPHRQAQLAQLNNLPEQHFDAQGTEIDLVALLYRMLASWKMIAIIVVVCIVAAVFYSTSYVTPMYRATSTIYVIGRDSGINLSDLQLGSNMMNDYMKVFDMWEVHDEVIKSLDLNYTYSQARSHLSVANSTGTHILDITFSSPDPQEAATVANEYANVVSSYISDTMRMDKPSVMSTALTPTNPYNISRTRSAAIGMIIGLLIGAGIVTVRFMLDDKIRTAEDVRRYTGLVNLAVIPKEEGLIGTHNSADLSKKKSKGRK